jgi:hypothetical protein
LEGWGLDVLLERLPAEAAVVVFELDPELETRCEAAWKAYLGPRLSDPRLFRLHSDHETSVQALFLELSLSKLRRCEMLTLNGAWTAHASRYREVFTRLDQGLVRWWSNRATSVHLGPLWVRNLFDNVAAGSPGPSAWPDWSDTTVLVCGAGLTLEDALPWARAHRSRLRILAADTALPVLRGAGLVPDAVVCLESQHANLRDFAGWSDSSVPLFADLTSFPPAARVLGGTTLWFASEFAPLHLWERWAWPETLPVIPPLGSVGVAAAWLALRLSRGAVVLAGLDFSYPAGKTHARGTPALAALAAATDRLHPMEQAGSWAKAGVRTTASGWLSTPVLEGYAGVLADECRAHRDRVWAWSAKGLPLGLRPWPNEAPPPARAQSTMGESPLPETSPGAWLDQERGRWERLLELFERMNAFPGDEAVWIELEAGLAEVDYLTFSFPDPEFRRASDWLIRAQAQIRWILGRTSRRRRS